MTLRKAIMPARSKRKKSLLFLATANLHLASEMIAHIRFLHPGSQIRALVPQKVGGAFDKLEGVKTIVTDSMGNTLKTSDLSAEAARKLKAVEYGHVYVASKFNTGNPNYYKRFLQFAHAIQPNRVSLINGNMRVFRYDRYLTEEFPSCGICNSRMTFWRYTTYPSVIEPAPLYKCQDCGFISQDFSRLDARELRDEYINLKIPWLNFLSEMVDKDHRDDLVMLQKHLAPSSTILDMGCGSGGLEYYARRDSTPFRVISLDLNRESINWSRSHGIDVHCVDIASRDEIEKKLRVVGCKRIGCIYSRDSLEHLVRPYDVLKMWSDLLSEGYICITLPTVDIVFDNYRGYEKFHLSYFTKNTLTRLAKRVGLAVVNSKVRKRNNGAGTGSMQLLLRKG